MTLLAFKYNILEHEENNKISHLGKYIIKHPYVRLFKIYLVTHRCIGNGIDNNCYHVMMHMYLASYNLCKKYKYKRVLYADQCNRNNLSAPQLKSRFPIL